MQIASTVVELWDSAIWHLFLARWDVGGDDQAAIAAFSVARLIVNRAAAQSYLSLTAVQPFSLAPTHP